MWQQQWSSSCFEQLWVLRWKLLICRCAQSSTRVHFDSAVPTMTLSLMVGNLCWLYMEHEFESSCWILCLDRSFNSFQNLKFLAEITLKMWPVNLWVWIKSNKFSVLKLGMYKSLWLGQLTGYTRCFFLTVVSHMPSLYHAFQFLPFLLPYVFFVPSVFISYLSAYTTILPAVGITPINPKCCSAVSNVAHYSRSIMEAEMFSQLMWAVNCLRLLSFLFWFFFYGLSSSPAHYWLRRPYGFITLTFCFLCGL